VSGFRDVLKSIVWPSVMRFLCFLYVRVNFVWCLMFVFYCIFIAFLFETEPNKFINEQ